MSPNREQRERVAERKAAATARDIISKAERTARRARRRRALRRDLVIAIFIALTLFGLWKLISWPSLVVAVP
jgi:hypothetical protein